MSRTLLQLIEDIYPNLSKSHKKIASFIKEHYDKAAFMTAFKLGETIGISESTVVRFAVELGFDGYPQLQSALRELIKNKLTAVQRMEVMSSRIGSSDVLSQVLSNDIDLIKNTLDNTDKKIFSQAVAALGAAKRIYVLGVRSSAVLANFLSYYLNLIYDNVTLVDTSSGREIFEQMFRIGSEDVCIAISFPRYSKQTINALKFISDRHARVISITDSEISPIAPFADHLLIARSDMASFADSLVAPLSLINALIVASTFSKIDGVRDNFNMLENIWDEYKVYEKTEDVRSDG